MAVTKFLSDHGYHSYEQVTAAQAYIDSKGGSDEGDDLIDNLTQAREVVQRYDRECAKWAVEDLVRDLYKKVQKEAAKSKVGSRVIASALADWAGRVAKVAREAEEKGRDLPEVKLESKGRRDIF